MDQPSDVLASWRSAAILLCVAGVLIGGYQLAARVFTRAPAFVRVQFVPGVRDRCSAEVWVAGKPGDVLYRLQETAHGRSWTTGIAILNKSGASVSLPTTLKSDRGECEITRYHLLVNGQEVDTLEAAE